jgi:hypothetical protein
MALVRYRKFGGKRARQAAPAAIFPDTFGQLDQELVLLSAETLLYLEAQILLAQRRTNPHHFSFLLPDPTAHPWTGAMGLLSY